MSPIPSTTSPLFLAAHALDGLELPADLVLSSFRIPALGPDALSGMQVVGDTVLAGVGLTALSVGAMSSGRTNRLDMSHNSIAVLQASTFTGVSVDTLDLSYNSLTFVEDGFVTELSTPLRTLILSHNNLSALPVSVLWSTATMVFADHNALTNSLPDFLSPVATTHVNVSRNKLVLPLPEHVLLSVLHVGGPAAVVDLSYNCMAGIASDATYPLLQKACASSGATCVFFPMLSLAECESILSPPSTPTNVTVSPGVLVVFTLSWVFDVSCLCSSGCMVPLPHAGDTTSSMSWAVEDSGGGGLTNCTIATTPQAVYQRPTILTRPPLNVYERWTCSVLCLVLSLTGLPWCHLHFTQGGRVQSHERNRVCSVNHLLQRTILQCAKHARPLLAFVPGCRSWPCSAAE